MINANVFSKSRIYHNTTVPSKYMISYTVWVLLRHFRTFTIRGCCTVCINIYSTVLCVFPILLRLSLDFISEELFFSAFWKLTGIGCKGKIHTQMLGMAIFMQAFFSFVMHKRYSINGQSIAYIIEFWSLYIPQVFTSNSLWANPQICEKNKNFCSAWKKMKHT